MLLDQDRSSNQATGKKVLTCLLLWKEYGSELFILFELRPNGSFIQPSKYVYDSEKRFESVDFFCSFKLFVSARLLNSIGGKILNNI